MKKKEIKEILKKYDYKMIGPSWFRGKKKEKSALFNTYDNTGNCYRWFVNWESSKVYANRQLLSNCSIHKMTDVSFMFSHIIGG